MSEINQSLRAQIEKTAADLKSQGKLIKTIKYTDEEGKEQIYEVNSDFNGSLSKSELYEKYKDQFKDLDTKEIIEASRLELDEMGKVWGEILSHLVIDYETNTIISPETYEVHYKNITNPELLASTETPETYKSKFSIINKLIVDKIPPCLAFIFGIIKVF